ncbi:MAG: hypothetical protein Q4F31_04995 [Eubacteriales bacterium]|nr:hypothetical protein [Eubacteriales bacterium]
MAVRKKTKRIIGTVFYYLLLLAYGAALAFGAYVVLNDTNKYLVAYEASQPASTIDGFMTELKSGIWDSKITELAASKAHPFQSAEECEQIIRDRVGDDLFYHRAGGNSVDGNIYNIYSGNHSVGSVTLLQDTAKAGSIDIGLLSNLFDRQSLCPWYVSSSEFDISQFGNTSSIHITCPSTFTVMINGNALGPEYVVESGIHYTEFEDYYADHANLPMKTRYEVNNLIFGSVEPVFYNRNGEVVSVDEDCITSEGDVTTYMINDMDFDPPSAEEMAELEGYADSFISPYLNYFGTKNVDMNAGALKALIVPGCDIERRMTEFLDGAAWIHYYSLQINSYNFDGAFSLGDGFYVIDVSYDATAYSEYKTVQQASTLRIVVCRTDTGLRAVSAE